ncbi:MAG: TRAP transporter large permease subunit [Dehalococcoidales bacterium]|nr:TRAP transporter large permease subunit [Dehalococcoidales bacterium]
MSPELAGIIGFCLMIAMVLLSINVSFAIIISGIIGLMLVMPMEQVLYSIATITFERAVAYDFTVIPLFMLMSSFIAFTNIGSEAYDMAKAWLGQYRGGLAMATVGACGLFAACTGTSMAGAIAMGKIAYPEMKRYGYDARLSLGSIASGATLGIMIPPSMGFILIGILTQISIGKLFIAGILPGIMQVILYFVAISVICRFKPSWGPVGRKTTVREKVVSFKLTWPVVILFLLIIGGMYGGIFSATEAGAIGAFGALVVAISKRQMNRHSFVASLLDSAQTTGMIFCIVVGAFIFKQFLAITRIPFEFSTLIAEIGINKYLILGLLVVVFVIMGAVFDIYAIIVMTVPIIFPTMEALGFDLLWFGVVMVKMMEMGDYTPPFGFNLFALSGTIREVQITDLYRGVVPFVACDVVQIILLTIFPVICTVLPGFMIG